MPTPRPRATPRLESGLSTLDAYQLLSQAVESPLANVVDTNYTSVAKVRKEWVPASGVMRRTHERLRAIAAEYRGDR